jgi:DNA-binding NarL/FixJ family response regulator
MEPNLEVCGEAETEQEALGGILALRPDLAVVDLSLKEGEGLALIRRLREHCSGLKILVFTMHDQAEFAAAAFAAGAHGYVVKEEGAEKLLEAIHMVMEGLRYLSAQVAAKAPGLGARMQGRGSAPP